jgi:hypothetical protein
MIMEHNQMIHDLLSHFYLIGKTNRKKITSYYLFNLIQDVQHFSND